MTEARRGLLTLLALAGLLRAAFIIYAASHPNRFDFPDSYRYVTVARNIAAGNGPIQSRDVLAGTDPAYPGVLALGIYLGCESTTALMNFGRVINSCCGLLVIWLVWLIGSVGVNSRVGWLAAVWSAVDPILLYFNALVLTELPYIAMLLGAMYSMLQWRSSLRLQWAWLAGALMGMGALTRSSSLFLFVPMLVLVLSCKRSAMSAGLVSRGHRAGGAALFLVGMALIMSPTIYRNYRLFDAFIPVRTGGGASLLEAWGPWADGGPGMEKIVYPVVQRDANEVQRDKVYRDAALAWARSHPQKVINLAWIKLRRTWSITMNAPGYQSGIYAVLCWLTVLPIFVLAAAGGYLQLHKRWLLTFLLVPAAYFTLVHMVFVGSVRYRLPAMPLLFILAAIAVDRLLTRRNEPRSIEYT